MKAKFTIKDNTSVKVNDTRQTKKREMKKKNYSWREKIGE